MNFAGCLRAMVLTARGCVGTPTRYLGCRNTSHVASRCSGRLIKRPRVSVVLPTTLCHDRLLAPHHITLSENIRLISTQKLRLEDNLSELRMKLERLGCLKLNDISQVVKSLEQCLDEVSDTDCLTMLQFCRTMAEQEYRPCGSLIQRVWGITTHRLGGKVSLEHLELYLHLCLAVESTELSERDVFEQIERHEIEVSTHTFELLITALGERGRLEEVRRVLAMMKERNVDVREATFAALILAYGADKDLESVEGVLDTMKSVQMTLSEVTFGALGVVYSTQGEVSKIRQLVLQAIEEGVPLSTQQLEAILMVLVKSGHAGQHYEHIDSVLRLVEENGMNLDISRLALRLIHYGHVMEAVHLLLSLPHLNTNNHLYSNAAIYLREIVHAQTDPYMVVEVCHRLQKEGINQYALQVALEHALRDQWEELAWVLLRAMKETGVPLREHYFWPLLHLKAIAQEPAELVECVEGMLDLGEAPGFMTLRDHVIPGLSLSQPRLALQMLQNAGLSLTATATPMLVVLLKNNMTEQAIKFVQEIKGPFNMGDALGTLAPAWQSSPKAIIHLLALLIHHRKKLHPSKSEEDWGGQFVLRLAATRTGLAVHDIRPLFQELGNHNIGVSEHSSDLLVSQLSRPLKEAVKASLYLVLQVDLGQPPLEQNIFLPHPRHMTEEELEGHLEELRTKGYNTRGSLRRLLLLRATRNDTDGVLELMQHASRDGVQVSPGMLSGVVAAYVKNSNIDAALDMFFHLNTQHPDFKVDSFKVLDLCTLLTKKGRCTETMEILQNYIMKTDRNFNTTHIRNNCRNLLLASANTMTSEETDTLFDLLLVGGLVKPDTVTLGVLVKSRLNRGDLRGGVETARRIKDQYRCLPMRRELLIHIIKHQQTTNESECVASDQLLEDMLALITEVKGSISAKHDLAYAYLEAGRPSEAATVLKNLGNNLDHRQLIHQLEYYVKNEREAVLMHLITASRGIDTIDRQAVYSSLLKVYYVQSEGEKGLALWTSMQEDEGGLTPSPSFLTTLAALLAACKIKIPFQI